MKVSIVLPAYNEELVIKQAVERVLATCKELKFEIIVVDDGSNDRTLNSVKDLRKIYPEVKFLSFSRNFGHQNALRAGIEHATGDCIVTMDADLQHPPELIHQMIELWQKGNQIVYTVRDDEENSAGFKKLTSALFYSMQNKLSDVKIQKGAADFRLIDRSVADLVKSSSEHDLFLRGFFSWIGFKQHKLSYKPNERAGGETKYSFKKMFNLALSGITSFSVRPLRLSIVLGLLCSLFAFSYLLYVVIVFFFTDQAVSGWASVIASVLLIGGIQLMVLGIIGEYLGKMFIQTKQRPPYLIKEKALD